MITELGHTANNVAKQLNCSVSAIQLNLYPIFFKLFQNFACQINTYFTNNDCKMQYLWYSFDCWLIISQIFQELFHTKINLRFVGRISTSHTCYVATHGTTPKPQLQGGKRCPKYLGSRRVCWMQLARFLRIVCRYT
jgi:hypothetical protein